MEFFLNKHIQQEQPGGHKSLRGRGGTATVELAVNDLLIESDEVDNSSFDTLVL